MKKRGFTLVELLAVLVLIATISLIIFPSIINYINSSKGDINETTKQLIITSANQYLDDKFGQKLNTTACFNIQTLIDNEYLEKSTIKNQAGNIDPNYTYIQAAYAIDPELKTEKYIIKIVTKCVVYGDVNLDGKVDSSDFDTLKKYVKGQTNLSEESLINADITLDGKVDVIDLAVLNAKTSSTPFLDKLPFSIDSDKFKFGDLNSDDKVTTEDATIAARYDVSIYDLTPLQKISGDVNLDGSLDIRDSLIITNYINNNKTLPQID